MQRHGAASQNCVWNVQRRSGRMERRCFVTSLNFGGASFVIFPGFFLGGSEGSGVLLRSTAGRELDIVSQSLAPSSLENTCLKMLLSKWWLGHHLRSTYYEKKL